MLNRIFKSIFEVRFCNSNCLKLMSYFSQNSSLFSILFKKRILSFVLIEFDFNFLNPFFIFLLSSSLTLFLKLFNILKLSFFFNFKESLFKSLVNHYIEYRENFTVVIKKFIIPDLCFLIHSCFLWNILRSGRLW